MCIFQRSLYPAQWLDGHRTQVDKCVYAPIISLVVSINWIIPCLSYVRLFLLGISKQGIDDPKTPVFQRIDQSRLFVLTLFRLV